MKKKIAKIFFIVVTLAISFFYTIKWLDTINFQIDEDLLDTLIENSSNLNPENKVINSLVKTITKSQYMDPVTMILRKYESENIVPNTNSSDKEPKEEPDDPKVIHTEEKEPIVYIYNTHQTEKYSEVSDTINLNFSVLDASYLLQKELKKYQLNSIVEKASIMDVLNANNWRYASSYRVSKMYMEQAKKNTPSLQYFIDLHRDSVSKKISTVEINGKKYARTMFLLGLENENYKQNQQVLQKLETWLKQNYPGLSRGIYEKQGPGVNGVYNQDFSQNCILIEVGGEQNTTEEVENTIEVIAQMLQEYIKEQKG